MTPEQLKPAYRPSQLIINKPFDEPSRYWRYDRATQLFSPIEGRRPAGYLIASPDAQGHNDPGVFVELPLVNQIRPLVKGWREAGHPGTTGITRRLLAHWYDQTERDNRFFFCQLEAIETIIWLTEAAPAESPGIEIPGDGGQFERWCTKLATGTGKTVVMAMLIAWQVLNKVADAQSERYGKNILIVAPGLTVRSRLQVLIPDRPDNYYDEFGIVPAAMYDQLRQGKVIVHNWHKLDWETDAQVARKRSVDKRGAKSDEAYVREVLGEMSAARNLIVVNDEAHHAWRVNAEAATAGVRREEIDEATKWVGGLDRIHRARGILRSFDFSATPFIPSGRTSSAESLFGWIVSDFGLNDAIEAGLVKTPRVVVRDDGRLTADYKSRLYHLYNDHEVKDDLNRKAEENENLPDLVTNGYYLLGKDWQETAEKWRSTGHRVPPVMITVANRTETAARVKYAFDHGKIRIEALQAPERTLHIDSKVLAKAEARIDGDDFFTEPAGDEESDDSERPERKLTKGQQAELLRRQVDTVGQPGQPGEQIQNVISVGMLSEGWDAKTVTHIMGLRAFSSQLLCEQVVGRGLRRTSYEINGDGFFDPEYVNIFGVPFTFLPHEEAGDQTPPPTTPKTRVEPLREREAEFAISWPNIVRIEHVYAPTLTLDVPKLERLRLNAADTTTYAELAAVLEGKPHITEMADIDLQELAQRFRMQRIVFEVTRDLYDQMQRHWEGNKEVLLAQLIRQVERVLASDRIVIEPALFNRDDLRRRLILTMHINKIVQHIWEAIRFENTERLEPVFDTVRPIMITADMRPWFTGRPCENTRRSHINVCVYDSRWEASESFVLDRRDQRHVAAWAKNDHLGFEVMYVFAGVVRKYRPDFLIRLASGTMLALEVKGENTPRDDTNRRFLAEWVRAVNADGGFGHWASDVSFNTADIQGILEKTIRLPDLRKGTAMNYDYIAIPDSEVPAAVEPVFQHLLTTYASEVNKTVGVWRAVADSKLDFRPLEKVNSIRTILVHQLLSERRFFAEFAGLEEPAVEELLPAGEGPEGQVKSVQSYIDKYVWLARRRLPQFARGTTEWWLEMRDFFGGLRRERIWIFWRRVLHTCHHRTQVQTWLRLAGEHVPAIYGPSGDVKWSDADPTYSVEAAGRGLRPQA